MIQFSLVHLSQIIRVTQNKSHSLTAMKHYRKAVKMKILNLRSSAAKFGENRKGNFAMMTAVLAPMILMAAGLSLDIANLTSLKGRMQAASDSVSLAIATRIAKGTLDITQAEAFGKALMQAQMADDSSRFSNMSINPTVTIAETGTGGNKSWRVTVGGNASQDTTPLAAFFGKDSMTVGTAATATSGIEEKKNSVSLGMVIDVSGSMGWYSGGVRRIDALKTASTALFAQLNDVDPDQDYVRTAVVAYHSSKAGQKKFNWGTAHTASFIAGRNAGGGTSSTQAFKWMANKIRAVKEDKPHENNTGQTPIRNILFMTDGSNNRSSDDGATITLCDKAKAEGTVVYTVAFGAPARGKALLKNCATSDDYYFEPSTASELIAAFENIGKATAKTLTKLTN
jgi:Flp pilus assembly protein TadG